MIITEVTYEGYENLNLWKGVNLNIRDMSIRKETIALLNLISTFNFPVLIRRAAWHLYNGWIFYIRVFVSSSTLFADILKTLLICCVLSHPKKVWKNFKDSLSVTPVPIFVCLYLYLSVNLQISILNNIQRKSLTKTTVFQHKDAFTCAPSLIPTFI